MSIDLRVLEDLEELSVEAARSFAGAARSAVRERGRFNVALAGGGTPRALYHRLAVEFRESIPWNDVSLFWSDERFVPPEHPDSNYRMVREAMLDELAIPSANVHRPETLGDPDECARNYDAVVRAALGPGFPRFDWILLGLGEDGHIASLFPGSGALDETERLVVAVEDSPKPPPVRLTMTLPLLDAAREVHLLVAGRSKREAVFRALGPAQEPLPAARLRPRDGRVHWWLDRLAATRGD